MKDNKEGYIGCRTSKKDLNTIKNELDRTMTRGTISGLIDVYIANLAAELRSKNTNDDKREVLLRKMNFEIWTKKSS